MSDVERREIYSLRTELGRLQAENKQLKDRLADIENATKAARDESCEDEDHCSCVPLLRDENRQLRQLVSDIVNAEASRIVWCTSDGLENMTLEVPGNWIRRAWRLMAEELKHD